MKKVLIIDKAATCEQVKQCLDPLGGYETGFANDWRQATERIAFGSYAVILCALPLDGCDGPTFLRAVKSLSPLSEIVVLTDSRAPEHAVASISAGANFYLLKPWSPSLLVELVQRASAIYQERLELRQKLQQEREASKLEAVARLALATAQQVDPPLTSLEAQLKSLQPELKRTEGGRLAHGVEVALGEVDRIREIILMMGILDRQAEPKDPEAESCVLDFQKKLDGAVDSEVKQLQQQYAQVQRSLQSLRVRKREGKATGSEVARIESEFCRMGERIFQHLQCMTDLALRDPLTGLYNRRFLEEEVKKEFYRTTRFGKTVGLLYMDIDNFKPINDRFGHDAGDKVLSLIGDRLRRFSRKSDVACRYGGDEFVLLMQEASEKSLLQAALKMKAAVETDRYPLGDFRHVRVSVTVGGFVFSGKNASTWEQIILKADQALLHARGRGKSRVEIVA